MKVALTITALLLVFFLLFGCTITINPQDLAPSKNYTVITDTNSNGPTPNSSTPNAGSSNSGQVQITLTTSEVAKHNKINDCWMIINRNAYDLSQYVGHPGGYTYVPYCGTDGTQGYNTKGGRGSMHSSYADMLLANYLIGQMGQTVTTTTNTTNTGNTSNSGTTTNATPSPTNLPARHYGENEGGD